MFAKILLLRFLSAQESTDTPPMADAPLFGPYTEDTSEKYDHDAMSMVWISFKTEEYAAVYYDGDSKKDMQETDATSVSSVFGPRMTRLAGEIESAVSKKYHIVFFDSKEYKDHAIEGLNCKVEKDTCISVLLPMGGEGKEEEEEVVYTRPLPDGNNLKESDESQMKFILDFVKLVESDSPEKETYKFVPSFDDDGADGEEQPEEDDGFGESDDDNQPEM
jgi:hypothetical protein